VVIVAISISPMVIEFLRHRKARATESSSAAESVGATDSEA